MKFIKYGLGIVLFISVQSIFAQDISGKWKTVDDKSGFSRADVLIMRNENNIYSGKILIIRPTPGKPTTGICKECKGEFKDKPLTGMQVISHFSPNPKNPDEYINGKVFDPISGKTYKGKIKLINRWWEASYFKRIFGYCINWSKPNMDTH